MSQHIVRFARLVRYRTLPVHKHVLIAKENHLNSLQKEQDIYYIFQTLTESDCFLTHHTQFNGSAFIILFSYCYHLTTLLIIIQSDSPFNLKVLFLEVTGF